MHTAHNTHNFTVTRAPCAASELQLRTTTATPAASAAQPQSNTAVEHLARATCTPRFIGLVFRVRMQHTTQRQSRAAAAQ